MKPKLRMVSWNLNTLRFGGDCIHQSSSEKVIGSLGLVLHLYFFTGITRRSRCSRDAIMWMVQTSEYCGVYPTINRVSKMEL